VLFTGLKGQGPWQALGKNPQNVSKIIKNCQKFLKCPKTQKITKNCLNMIAKKSQKIKIAMQSAFPT